MSNKAQSQFTIVDYNDALALAGFITTNQQKTQMFNPDNNTYNPDWTKTNMVLTPSLFIAGTATDIIASASVLSIKWYEGNSTTPITSAGNYALSGAKSHILTIKANVLAGLSGKDFRFEASYKDATTGLVLPYSNTVALSRVINGGGIVDLIGTTPNGNIFKNDDITSLLAKVELWRGSVIDTTNVTYQWYKMDPSVVVDEGGGIGWKKLTETAGKWTGVTSNTLTIFSSAVDSYATFKCVAKDTDSTSSTYNKSFVDICSFVDNSDPLYVEIFSSGGNIFKNGVGSTILTAKVYQAGTEIDTEGTGTYQWSKYDKDGNKVTTFSKTGKTLSVGSADVATKATFVCEVTL